MLASQSKHAAIEDGRTKSMLPNFCSITSVFTLILVAELVVVIDALAPDARMHWRGFATATLFVVWLALLSSLLLCRIVPRLAKLPRVPAYLLALAEVGS